MFDFQNHPIGFHGISQECRFLKVKAVSPELFSSVLLKAKMDQTWCNTKRVWP